jgi:hypothetical protein
MRGGGMMELEDKQFAEKALKYLFVGSQIDGIKFGLSSATTLLYFMHYDRGYDDHLWLHIESEWILYTEAPDTYPISEEEIHVNTEEEQFKAIFDIRREKVVDIRLGDISPHLIITLESGKVLFINGYHPDYECWQTGDGGAYVGDDWLLVAVPGDDIAVSSPDSFK